MFISVIKSVKDKFKCGTVFAISPLENVKEIVRKTNLGIS